MQMCHPAQFATLVIGEANRAGNMELINAGQTPVLFAHDHSTKVLPATQVPLGLFCGLQADPVSTTVHEQAVPYDMLLLYSDGVTEKAFSIPAYFPLPLATQKQDKRCESSLMARTNVRKAELFRRIFLDSKPH
jgi:serine phosphatase RsbU (regulator of sigma subunit)